MEKRMHLANFTNTYYPVISGVVRSVSSFRQALSDLGHNVFVFAQEAPEYEDNEPFIFRYPALKLGFPGDSPATIPFSPFIDNLFPSLKADVIHSHHPILLGKAASNKAEKYHLPLVFTYHSRYREYSKYVSLKQEFVDEFVKDAIKSWVGRYMRRCQHIVVPSESIRDKLKEDYGEVTPVTVIPTGIDLKRYRNSDGCRIRSKHGWVQERVLISVGRLAIEKNWKTLLKAAGIVMEKHPAVRLVLIGDGDEREHLEDLARELRIAKRVEFVGKIPFDDVPCYLRAADLFCFASTSETQGLVTMEAMCAGLPVVAVDATGTRDVVDDDKEGLLTEDDSQALAQGICTVLENQDLAQRLKQATLEKARSFAIEIQAQRLLDAYNEAIEARQADHFVKVNGVANDHHIL